MMQVQHPTLKVKCLESTDKKAIEDKYIQRSGGSSLYEKISWYKGKIDSQLLRTTPISTTYCFIINIYKVNVILCDRCRNVQEK